MRNKLKMGDIVVLSALMGLLASRLGGAR